MMAQSLRSVAGWPLAEWTAGAGKEAAAATRGRAKQTARPQLRADSVGLG